MLFARPKSVQAVQRAIRRGAGFFFGRTPLIKLSPKKTWEGFLGGLVLTVLCSWLLADLMSRWSWMTCPRTVRTTLPKPLYQLGLIWCSYLLTDLMSRWSWTSTCMLRTRAVPWNLTACKPLWSD